MQHMDFAVLNSHAIQFAHAGSFDVQDQKDVTKQVRSWGWAVSKLRDVGGQLETPRGQFDVAREVDVEVAVIEPERYGRSAYEDALGVFDDLTAKVIEVGHAKEIADGAADLLAAS